MGRIFTAQPVFHYRSDTAKAQHRPVGLLCQQLLWDGAEPLGSALGQTQRKADNGIKANLALLCPRPFADLSCALYW